MNKKKTILITSLILLIIVLSVIIMLLLTKNKRVEGVYYVKVNDGNAPGSTYTLNIDKDGNYKMNEHFSAALSTGIEEQDTDYSGTFSASTMDKIYSISKKIDETKDGYILYIEPDIDFEDGKWYASAQLVRAISFIDSKDKNYNEYGNSILDEINKLDIKDMPNIERKIYNNCRLKRD